jgi:hypothetical protein
VLLLLLAHARCGCSGRWALVLQGKALYVDLRVASAHVLQELLGCPILLLLHTRKTLAPCRSI